MTKNTAKKTQTVKKTTRNIFQLSTSEMKLIHGGGRGVIIVIGGGGRGGYGV